MRKNQGSLQYLLGVCTTYFLWQKPISKVLKREGMTIFLWIVFYMLDLVFWLWIIRWGGAERLEGTLTSGGLVDVPAPRWSAEGINLFGWLMLVGSIVLFIGGLIYPGIRTF